MKFFKFFFEASKFILLGIVFHNIPCNANAKIERLQMSVLIPWLKLPLCSPFGRCFSTVLFNEQNTCNNRQFCTMKTKLQSSLTANDWAQLPTFMHVNKPRLKKSYSIMPPVFSFALLLFLLLYFIYFFDNKERRLPSPFNY